jgi:hypothetical protein
MARSRPSSRGKPLTKVVPPSEEAPATRTRRADRRRAIYAGLDLGLAALHGVIAAVAAPTRHLTGQLLFWTIVAAFVLAAAGTLFGRPLGWRIASAALVALLVLELLLVVALLTSAAYLSGVFGAFGKGAAAICIAAIFLSVQTTTLVPALQLKYLRTRAGRRAFGRPVG